MRRFDPKNVDRLPSEALHPPPSDPTPVDDQQNARPNQAAVGLRNAQQKGWWRCARENWPISSRRRLPNGQWTTAFGSNRFF